MAAYTEEERSVAKRCTCSCSEAEITRPSEGRVGGSIPSKSVGVNGP